MQLKPVGIKPSIHTRTCANGNGREIRYFDKRKTNTFPADQINKYFINFSWDF